MAIMEELLSRKLSAMKMIRQEFFVYEQNFDYMPEKFLEYVAHKIMDVEDSIRADQHEKTKATCLAAVGNIRQETPHNMLQRAAFVDARRMSKEAIKSVTLEEK